MSACSGHGRQRSTRADVMILDEFEVLRDLSDRVLRGEILPSPAVVGILVDTIGIVRTLIGIEHPPIVGPWLGSPPEWAVAALEAMARLSAVRDVTEAIVTGVLVLEEPVTASLTRLAGEAHRWAAVSKALAA